MKRFISLFLALLLVVSSVPVIAQDEEPIEETSAVAETVVEQTQPEPIVMPIEASEELPTPVESPVVAPAEELAEAPTETPTEVPTEAPTEAPTEVPTEAPTETPTEVPTEAPTETPTETPTEAPTEQIENTSSIEETEEPTTTPDGEALPEENPETETPAEEEAIVEEVPAEEVPEQYVQALIDRIQALPDKEATAITDNFSLQSFESLEAEIAELMALVDQLSADELAMVTNLEKLLALNAEAEETRKILEKLLGNIHINFAEVPQLQEIEIGETFTLSKDDFFWTSYTDEQKYQSQYKAILNSINKESDRFALTVSLTENEDEVVKVISKSKNSIKIEGKKPGKVKLVIGNAEMNISETIEIRVRNSTAKINSFDIILSETEIALNKEWIDNSRYAIPVEVIINDERVNFSELASQRGYRIVLREISTAGKTPPSLDVDFFSYSYDEWDSTGFGGSLDFVLKNSDTVKTGTYTVNMVFDLKKNNSVLASTKISTPVKVKIYDKKMSVKVFSKITYNRFDEIVNGYHPDGLYPLQNMDAYSFDGMSYGYLDSIVILDKDSPFEIVKPDEYNSEFFLKVKSKLTKSNYKVKCQATCGGFKNGIVQFVLNVSVKNDIPKMTAPAVTMLRKKEETAALNVYLPKNFSKECSAKIALSPKSNAYPYQEAFSLIEAFNSDKMGYVSSDWDDKKKMEYYQTNLCVKNAEWLKGKKSVKVLLNISFKGDDYYPLTNIVQVPVTVQLKENAFTYKLSKSSIVLNKQSTGSIPLKVTCSPACNYFDVEKIIGDDSKLFDISYYYPEYPMDRQSDEEPRLLVSLNPKAKGVNVGTYKLKIMFTNCTKPVDLSIKIVDQSVTAKLKKNTLTLDRLYSDSFDNTQVVFSQQIPDYCSVSVQTQAGEPFAGIQTDCYNGKISIRWDKAKKDRMKAGTYKLRLWLKVDGQSITSKPLSFTLKVVEKARLSAKMSGTLDLLTIPVAYYEDIYGVKLTDVKLLNTDWKLDDHYDTWDKAELSIEGTDLLMLRQEYGSYYVTWKDFGAQTMLKNGLKKINFTLKLALHSGEVFRMPMSITPKQQKPSSVEYETASLTNYGTLNDFTCQYKGSVMLNQKYPNLVYGIKFSGRSASNTPMIIRSVAIADKKKAGQYEIVPITSRHTPGYYSGTYGIRYKNGKPVTTVNDSVKLEVWMVGALKPVYVTVKVKNLK